MKTELKVWKGEIPLKNLYTAGLAGNEFFRVLKEQGEFLGSFCRDCELTYVPARYFCERCFANLQGHWRTFSGEGKLVSWTQCYISLDGRKLKKPVAVGAVQLDGASTTLIHYLKLPQGQLRIGAKVK